MGIYDKLAVSRASNLRCQSQHALANHRDSGEPNKGEENEDAGQQNDSSSGSSTSTKSVLSSVCLCRPLRWPKCRNSNFVTTQMRHRHMAMYPPPSDNTPNDQRPTPDTMPTLQRTHTNANYLTAMSKPAQKRKPSPSHLQTRIRVFLLCACVCHSPRLSACFRCCCCPCPFLPCAVCCAHVVGALCRVCCCSAVALCMPAQLLLKVVMEITTSIASMPIPDFVAGQDKCE